MAWPFNDGGRGRRVRELWLLLFLALIEETPFAPADKIVLSAFVNVPGLTDMSLRLVSG